jgi:ribonuclease D
MTASSAYRSVDPTSGALLAAPEALDPAAARPALDALEAARRLTEPPELAEPQIGPPPPMRWAKRKPEAAAALEAARSALTELSQRVAVPAENLVSPDLVRRLCWDWAGGSDVPATVDAYLREAGARGWQRDLVVPTLAGALSAAGTGGPAATDPAAADPESVDPLGL